MSGDQVLHKSLLPTEKIAEQKETCDIFKKSTEPNNVFHVRVNGLNIQSTLNPNALEFAPSHLQNKPQVKLSQDLRKLTLKVAAEERLTQEISPKNPEQFSSDFEPMATKNIDSNETNEIVNSITKVEEVVDKNESHNAIKDGHENNDLNMEKNQLCLLFASSCNVQHTESSETEISISEDNNDIENKAGNTPEEPLNDRKMEINESNTEKEPLLNESIPKISNNTYDNVKDCLEKVNETNKSENEQEKQILNDLREISNQKVFELREHTNPEVQTTKEFKIADFKRASTSEDHNNNNILKESTHPKGKLNVKSKAERSEASKISTFRKSSLLTKPKIEVKECKNEVKEIKFQTPTKIVQSSKIAKDSKNSLITKTVTISKALTSSVNKPILQTHKKVVNKSVNNDTISNRSSSFTDQSSPSTTRSSTQSSKVKCNEKNKTKESVPKTPRATVASKLRKTETQKRRNLFFDLDTIKMSDFLFK